MTTIKAIETTNFSISLLEVDGGYIVGYSLFKNGKVVTKLTSVVSDYNTASAIFEEKVEDFYTQH